MTTMVDPSKDYIALNAMLNMYGPDGKLQLDKEKEAVRAYFLEHVNKNTMFFHSLEEKADYLVENDYWDKSVLDKYDFEFIKEAFRAAYAKKYRFASLLGAYKYYTTYTLKSNDGKTYLERFEDRIAMVSLALADGDKQLALNFIEEIIDGRYQPATPTFQNAGKSRKGEYVSCFLLRAEDSLDSISYTWNACAQLSKIGGGVAVNLSNLRERGAPLKGKEGLAKGIVSWMKIYEDIFSTVDQLGTRQGAGAMYLSAHHPDILDFLDTKRENADEKIRVKTLSLGIVMPDKVFELARAGDHMYLFSPHDIMKVYGKGLADISITEKYDEMVNDARISKKKINPRKLLSTIAELQMESGYPYLVFEDTVNAAHALSGRVSMSNLCQPGDARINTTLGYKRLDDLYKSQETFKVVVDKRARDMDLSALGTSLEDSTTMQLTAKQAEIFKLKTAEGFENKATAWHKYYVVRDNGEYVKIPLKDVKVGDKVLIQSGLGAFGNVHKPDLAYLAGAYAADGTLVRRSEAHISSSIDLFGSKQRYQQRIEDTAQRVIEKYVSPEAKCDRAPTFGAPNNDGIRLYSAGVAQALVANGVDETRKTRVPEFIFSGDEETVSAYLDGLFSLDGSVYSTGPGSWCFSITSIDNESLVDIQTLLLNLGIYSRIHAISAQGDSHVQMKNGKEVVWNHSESSRLIISDRASRDALAQIVDFKPTHRETIAQVEKATKRKASARHKNLATVTSVEFAGVEDVYDVTVENGHSIIFNGIATGNCSEILQQNAPAQYDTETGQMTEVGQDISCNLGSMNVDNAMRSPDFGKTVEVAMRALTAVADQTNLQRVPTIKKANDTMHSVGLGQMSLATFFARNKIMYGDPDSLDFTDKYFMLVNYHTLVASNKIAVERGASFAGFEDSDYYNGKYFDYYLNEGNLTPTSAKVKDLFKNAGIELPTVNDWEELKNRIQKNGLWHGYRNSVPPTGSISYFSNSSASIHPITAPVEIRKEGGGIGRMYYPAPHLSDENLPYYKDAYELGYKALIDVYAEATKHVDQGLSCTLFFNDTVTTRDINKAQMYAWRKGIKTLYYIRLRDANVLEGTEVEGCVACAV